MDILTQPFSFTIEVRQNGSMVPAAAITSTMTQSPLALVFMLTRLASRVGVNNRLEGNALEIIAAMISDDQ